MKAFSISFDLRDNLSYLEEASCFKLLALVDSHPAITKAEDQECFNTLFKKLPEEWQKLLLEPPCSLIPYYMYMYIMYIYIYTLYAIQDPGPCIHVTVYTDPYPVPHETTNTVYH